MRCAIIDIGSNTVKMNVYDVTPPDIIKPILGESATLGLLGYIAGGALSEEGVTSLCKTISGYVKLASDIGVTVLRCVATAALRQTDNADYIIAEVKARTGCEIDLISGENEALLGLEGVKSCLGGDDKNGNLAAGNLSAGNLAAGVMIDMGGGSTELVGFIDGRAVRAVSEPFGCLSLFSRFVSGVLPEKSELRELRRFVNSRMDGYDWLKNYGETLYAVGGTCRLIGRMHYELFNNDRQTEYENGYAFTRDELKTLYNRFKAPSTDDIRALIRVAPDRIHTFVPGLCAINKIAAACAAEKLVVCFSGIREGYVRKLLLNEK